MQSQVLEAEDGDEREDGRGQGYGKIPPCRNVYGLCAVGRITFGEKSESGEVEGEVGGLYLSQGDECEAAHQGAH